MTDEELDAVLQSEVISHADVYDLLHTLQSYDGGGKYHRTAYDSIRVIRRLMWEYRKLREESKPCNRDNEKCTPTTGYDGTWTGRKP